MPRRANISTLGFRNLWPFKPMSFSTPVSHFLVISPAITDTSIELLDLVKIDDGKRS